MKIQLSQLIKSYVLPFAELYHRYKVKAEGLRGVRYRIHSTLADYQRTRTIQLSIADKPGDFLLPLTIEEIKKMPDILSGLHPIDVNSINDLYYLSQDKVVDVRVEDELIYATKQDGSQLIYDINEPFQYQHAACKRVAFMVGYMQAEKMMHKAYAQETRYTVIQDNIATLQVFDSKTNEHVLMSPLDILFSDCYKDFSKEDIVRIGYICGQMSQAA